VVTTKLYLELLILVAVAVGQKETLTQHRVLAVLA
jgi:hypothetical protein